MAPFHQERAQFRTELRRLLFQSRFTVSTEK